MCVTVKWVKLAHYCELTGETRNAVYQRRYSGKWLGGVHCQIRDRALWINLPEAQKWVEAGKESHYQKGAKPR